jgi:L-serine dehydratase
MIASIFNDVVGPVMRGASSSHCAAALRIGRLARDLMVGEVSEVLIEFDRAGSLPTTHDSQGSDMGLFGGLLGWEADDDRLPDSGRAIRDHGTTVRFAIGDFGDPHPNTYRLTLINPKCRHTMRAISTGGGMIEVEAIDDISLRIGGDYFETLVWVEGALPDGLQPEEIAKSLAAEEAFVHRANSEVLVQIRSRRRLEDAEVFRSLPGCEVSTIKRLDPVLPVLSSRDHRVPYSTCAEMLAFDAGGGRPLWELAVGYERVRGGLTEREVIDQMVRIVRILRHSIAIGVEGTHYEDRILGAQAPAFERNLSSGKLLSGGLLDRIVLYVTALMEVKSSMGVIVAAPTAGACAAFPASVISASEELGLSEVEMAKAMLAGGLIGVFIASAWTFAAEVGGCQAEGGSAACMAAASLCSLGGGTLDQCVAAASMALQNMIGLICDPVGRRVEVPCLGKNVMAAANALTCANMALSGFDPVIPLDEVIQTAKRVSNQMPRELRCTGLGGLAITDTALAIEQRLSANLLSVVGPS